MRLATVVGFALALALCLLRGPAQAADLEWPYGVEADVFGRAVRAEISRAYGVAPEAVTLEGLPARGKLPLPDIGVSGNALRIRDQALRTASGRSSLPVDILEAGKLKRIVPLAVRITVWSDVVVARGAIARGDRLTADRLAVQRKPVHTLQKGVFTRLADAVGQTAVLPILAGSVLNSFAVKAGVTAAVNGTGRPVVDVRSGTEVTVRVSTNGLSLVGKGRVLDSGAVGGSVRVQLLNFAGSKIVRARVFSAQEVRVDLEETP
jgi:flagella basal body P-ring formation protein FlgA